MLFIATVAAACSSSSDDLSDARNAAPIDAGIVIDAFRADATVTDAPVDARLPIDAIVVDAGPTLFVTIVSRPNAQTEDPTALIEFDASRESTFQCQLDGAAATPCHSPLALHVATNGHHDVAVIATALDGTMSAPAHARWLFDATLPVVDLTQTPDGVSSDPSPSFGFSGNEALTFQCSIDGAVAPMTCTTGWTPPTPLTGGCYTFTVTGTDSAGASNSASYVWAVPLFEGGDGSTDSPFQIATVDELVEIDNACFLTYSFQLLDDIDLTNVAFVPVPAGYSGNFDGNGHTIANWTYAATGAQGAGFFSEIDSGSVENLGLINVNVTGTAQTFVAGLVNYASSATLTNDYVTGTIGGQAEFAAGLVSTLISGNVSSCYVDVEVTATTRAGGLCDFSNNSTISDCHASGTVTGAAQWAGGLIAVSSDDIISSCHSDVTMIAGEWQGGLIGVTEDTSVSDAYVVGAVSSLTATWSGGLVGAADDSTFNRVYDAGTFVGTSTFFGALIGAATGTTTVTDGFWDTGTTNVFSGSVGTSESDSAMRQQSTYSDFDFVNTWVMGSSGFPELR